MATTVKYKGNVITTITNQTKVLNTSGKYMEDDVTIEDVSAGGSAVVVTEELDEGGGIIKHITAVDLSNDTVDAAHLYQGYTAHNFQGEPIVGTMSGGGTPINNQNKTVSPSTEQQSITYDNGYTGLGTVTVQAMPTGIAGTPTATKSAVSNHTITITPSVTNSAGYISNGTKTGTAVTVSASELVSGSQTLSDNGTYDVTNYASVNVDVPTGVDCPIFSMSFDDQTGDPVITCDKTYSEIDDIIGDNYAAALIFEDDPPITTAMVGFIQIEGSARTFIYRGYDYGAPYLEIAYHPNGTIDLSEYPQDLYSTLDVSSNGTYTAPWGTLYSEVNVDVSSGTPNLQNKSVIPSETAQTITADSGYDGLDEVNVSAIPSNYVGSGITQRSSADLTASGATVTVPSGFYESQATKSVDIMTLPTSAASTSSTGYTSKATIGRSTSNQYINIPPGYNSAGAYYTISSTPNGSVTAPSTITGTAATVTTGTNTLTLTKSVSVTPNVTTAGYITSGTAGNASVSLTASITTKAAATITPGTSNQTIASGTYLTGTQTISGDANLVGSNILNGKSIFGVNGTVTFQTYYTGSTAPTAATGSNGDIYLQT